MQTHPLGRLPKAKINCKSRKARYKYFRTVLTIGVAVLPNGNALCVLPDSGAGGLPTRSMMTEVVSQYEARTC